MFHSFHNCSQSFFVQPQTQTWSKEADKKNAKMQDICNKETKTTAASLVRLNRNLLYLTLTDQEARALDFLYLHPGLSGDPIQGLFI